MAALIPQMLSVAVAGTTVTSGAGSAEAAIPNDASGSTAKAVLISCVTPAGGAFVKPVQTGTAATTNDVFVGYGAPRILWVQGFTHIAYIQSVAATALNIVPLEC